MALTSVHLFRTMPGHLVEHRTRTDEARVLLQELGVTAVTIEPIAGTDANVLGTVVQYADNREYASTTQRIRADERWQAFYADAMSTGAAEPVESSLFQDLDPTHAPAADRPMGVIQATQWRPNPGRMGGFIEHVGMVTKHIERLGGSVRVMQSMFGAQPLTALVSVTFEDLDHFGEYGDKLAVDEQFQNAWGEVMTDPTAVLLRAGIYVVTA